MQFNAFMRSVCLAALMVYPVAAQQKRQPPAPPTLAAVPNDDRPRCDAADSTGRLPQAATLSLDETGVSDWRFQNPVNPFRLCDVDLEIKNETGSRTFVVTMPYVYKNDELAGGYSAAAFARGGVPLREVVCRALDVAKEVAPNSNLGCDAMDADQIQDRLVSLEALRLFREMVRAADAKKAPDPATGTLCDISRHAADRFDPATFEIACHVESVYWTAACRFRQMPESEGLIEVLRLATDDRTQRKFDRLLRDEARGYVARLFDDDKDIKPGAPADCTTTSHTCDKCRDFDPTCETCAPAAAAALRTIAMKALDPAYAAVPGNDCHAAAARRFAEAVRRDDVRNDVQKILDQLEVKKLELGACGRVPQQSAAGPDRKATKQTPIGTITGLRPQFAAESQFKTSHFQAAVREIMDAIDGEMDDLNRKLAPASAPAAINIRKRLEDLRDKVLKAGRKVGKDADIAVACHTRNLEAAARLVASYDDTALVPYRDVPASLYSSDPRDECPPVSPPPARTDLYNVQSKRAEDRAQARRQEGMRPAEAEVDIVGCETEGANTTCIATATILPNQVARFRRDLFRRSPEVRIRLNVAYFNETEPPPNPAAHLIWPTLAAETVDKPKGRYTFGFGADGTTGYDLPKDLLGHLRHTSGSASVTFQYAGPVEVSATLRFKNGDFGGPTTTNTVEASQYQAKIFGAGGYTLQYGRLTFAQPTSGIAVAAKGEGLRATLREFSLAYLISRESDAPDKLANSSNDDADTLIFQWAPTVRRGIRQLVLTALYGEEKNDHPITNKDLSVTVPVPYEHYTIGADLRIPTRIRSIVFGAGGYHSRRDMRPHALLADRGDTLENPGDSQGNVFLATAAWNRITPRNLADPPSKTNPSIGVALFLGHGTGDDPETSDRREGFIGEHAGYANDFMFLRTIAASDVYSKKLGRGLSNKTYIGLQYTDARWSPLAYIADRIFGAKSDITSRGTILGVHYYDLTHKPDGATTNRPAYELNAEFKLEAPRNVRWFLKGGFLHTPETLEQIGVPSDPWIVSTGVSITLDGR